MQGQFPAWVPEDARHYLTHTEGGRGIRDIARISGCHPSTVSRQVRRIELRRDDPLVDAALTELTEAVQRHDNELPDNTDAAADFERESLRALRRLGESGAVLAVAEAMEKAVVARDDGQGGIVRTGVVDVRTAQALALNGWIACRSSGRISRYGISASGRAALGQMLAASENRARSGQDTGFAEAQSVFKAARRAVGDKMAGEGQPPAGRARYGAVETPLQILSRRRDRDGKPFLSADLIAVGERLREDFELARTLGEDAKRRKSAAAESARQSVSRALAELGPGLSDVVLRCCCYLEGLEVTEKRMGWSARSGKIVLRIALQRLSRHYAESEPRERMIG